MDVFDSQSATQTGANGLKRGQAGSDRVKRGQGDDRIGALRTDSDPKTAPERRRAAAEFLDEGWGSGRRDGGSGRYERPIVESSLCMAGV